MIASCSPWLHAELDELLGEHQLALVAAADVADALLRGPEKVEEGLDVLRRSGQGMSGEAVTFSALGYRAANPPSV